MGQAFRFNPSAEPFVFSGIGFNEFVFSDQVTLISQEDLFVVRDEQVV